MLKLMCISPPIWCNICEGLFKTEGKNDETGSIKYTEAILNVT